MLGAILVSRNKTNVVGALTKAGVPTHTADNVANSFSTHVGSGAVGGSGRSGALVHQVQLAYAHSTQTVFYIMAGVMAATFIVALRWMPRGRVEAVDREAEAGGGQVRPETSV